jgi:hypothetical protein
LNDEHPGTRPYDDYNPGAKDPFGRTIRTVIGRHRQFIVYVTTDPVIGWNSAKAAPRAYSGAEF